MLNVPETASLTPTARFHQIATILARGVLRLRKRPKSEEAHEPAPEGLDVARDLRLNGTEGLTP